jgi:hypothetical protein
MSVRLGARECCWYIALTNRRGTRFGPPYSISPHRIGGGEFGYGHHSSCPGPARSLSGILNVDWQDFGARGKLALKGYPSQDGQGSGVPCPKAHAAAVGKSAHRLGLEHG